MHEAPLMTDLMREIAAAAAAQQARRILGVSVWLGALSHFSAAHFREHFSDAAAGTRAEGARLDVTVSEDIADAHAADVRLVSLELEI